VPKHPRHFADRRGGQGGSSQKSDDNTGSLNSRNPRNGGLPNRRRARNGKV